MSFSYASTDPGSSGMSWVRMRVGDTSSGSYQLENEEIDALLDTEGNKYLAAAVAAETLGARNAVKPDRKVGNLFIGGSKVASAYFKLAQRLRYEAGMRAQPYAGGISVNDKQTQDEDTDRVPPGFTVGQFSDPQADATLAPSTGATWW